MARLFPKRPLEEKKPTLVKGDGVVPGREEVARAEEALAWVLWALFAYAEEIGLKAPPFW